MICSETIRGLLEANEVEILSEMMQFGSAKKGWSKELPVLEGLEVMLFDELFPDFAKSSRPRKSATGSTARVTLLMFVGDFGSRAWMKLLILVVLVWILVEIFPALSIVQEKLN